MNKLKRITIADDDAGILDAVSMMLEMEGYEVEATLNGNTIINESIDVLDVYILDIWMSGSDGRELCKKLKSQEKTKNIPVILISASNDLKGSAEFAGADDFLAKPFEIDMLLSKIEKALHH
ncbi:MAG: response regulator [Pedobacter sp.]|nr:MAG: response regulator [Pedobacter sp.]